MKDGTKLEFHYANKSDGLAVGATLTVMGSYGTESTYNITMDATDVDAERNLKNLVGEDD